MWVLARLICFNFTVRFNFADITTLGMCQEVMAITMLTNDTNASRVQIRQGRYSQDWGRKDEVNILIASMKTSRQLLVAIKKQLQAKEWI